MGVDGWAAFAVARAEVADVARLFLAGFAVSFVAALSALSALSALVLLELLKLSEPLVALVPLVALESLVALVALESLVALVPLVPFTVLLLVPGFAAVPRFGVAGRDFSNSGLRAAALFREVLSAFFAALTAALMASRASFSASLAALSFLLSRAMTCPFWAAEMTDPDASILALLAANRR